MNRIFCLFAPLLALVLFASCKKDDVLYYNDVTFVNAADGVYITDYGLTYDIVENATVKEIPRDGRLILQCDILKVRGDGVYEVRVTQFAVPLTKDPVPSVAEPEADDPIQIENGWFSGGYFNTLLGLFVKDESDVKHLINLEYTLPDEANDTLYLRLRHNALGELPADPEDETDEYSYARTYACFHLNGLQPSGTEVPVQIQWNWYNQEGDLTLYKYKLKLTF